MTVNSTRRFSTPVSFAVVLFTAFLIVRCGSEEDLAVRSYLKGTITIGDSTIQSPDNSGFQVVVLWPRDGRVDTLAKATTDDDGNFSTNVRVSEAGLYPILVRRSGGVLKSGTLIVAEGDTAVVLLTLPTSRRPLVIRSKENGAWMAYQNAKASYNQSIADLVKSGTATNDNVEQTILQSAGMMWNMADVYPETIGAHLAAVESLMMLGTVQSPANDSLIIGRVQEVKPTNPGYVDAGRVGWRAKARSSGLADAISLLETMREQTDKVDNKAALQSEIVLAYQDSLKYDEARDAANRIRAAYNETGWGEWAESAIYELDNLRPGQRAPELDVLDSEGRRIRLSEQSTPWVVLEFYEPRNEVFQREVSTRKAFQASEVGKTVTFVSVSLEADADLNEAFRERDLKGIHIVAPDGFSDPLSKKFNVNRLPKRFLIKDGIIVGKFSGQALDELISEIERPA